MKKKDKYKERRKKYQDRWNTILMEYYFRLLGFARFILQNNSNVVLRRQYAPEDIVNDVVERILYYSVDPEGIKNKWAYQKQTLKHIVIDLGKKANKMPTDSIDDEDYPEAELPVENPSVLTKLEIEEMQKGIAQATHDLNDTEKQIFMLYLDGYLCQEIADEIGRDVNYVRYVINATKVKVKYRIKQLTKSATP